MKDNFSKSVNSCFGSHFLMSNIKMFENQVLEPRIFEDLERVKGFEPSTPTLARLCSTTELHPRRTKCVGICFNLANLPRVT